MDNMTNKSSSKVILMCGPAGSGKSTFAQQFVQTGMVILSYDVESFERGIKTHPLPSEMAKPIKEELDKKLLSLLEQNVDVVLDYSFWSKAMRQEYLSLVREYGVEPTIYYIKTPKNVTMERIRQRTGATPNDMLLSEETASQYFDQFEPPTDDEGKIIVIKGGQHD